MKEFQNRVAVITGAASGFGREFARTAADLGMKLALADIEQNALDSIQDELENKGVEVIAINCDVRKSEDMQALADEVMEKFGVIHLLFNNAGVGTGGLIWENSASDWEWVLGVNLWGVIHGVRIFTPLMLACAKADTAYDGHIVNTASTAGLLNAPTMGIYNVSKHAVVSLTETLYHDLQLINAPISASVVCPYFVPTGISQSQRNRPEELKVGSSPTLSQRVTETMIEKAVDSGKVTAADIAACTFEALREDKFYIYSHPKVLGNVRMRMEDIVSQRNPSDPFASVPQMRDFLRSQMGIE